MRCKYCGSEMEPIALAICNGWECPNCEHTYPNSFALAGGFQFYCACRNCTIREKHMRKRSVECKRPA